MFQAPFEKTYRFYRASLNQKQQECYDVIVRNILDYRSEIELPHHLSQEELDKTFWGIMYDYPLFFFVNTYSGRSIGSKYLMRIHYRILKENVQPMLDRIMKKARDVVNPLSGKSEDEKELAIHDFLAKKVTYDKNRDYYVHQIIGVFLYDKAVCEGIAKSAKLLFDLADMRSIVVTGYGNTYNGAEGGSHAWNIVWIGKEPYQLDVTFDNSKGDAHIDYTYYNLTDEQMGLDHRMDPVNVSCTVLNDYYRSRGLYFLTRSEIRSYFLKGLSYGQEHFGFRLDPDRPHEGLKKHVLDVFEDCMREKRNYKRYYSSFREAQCVMTIDLV